MRVLIGKLNPLCKKALEKAVALCVSQGQAYVDIDHFLITLLESPESDALLMFRYYEIDTQTVLKQLYQSLKRHAQSHTPTPVLSQPLLSWFEQSWMLASLQLNHTKIRSGVLLWGLIDTDTLRGVALEICPLLLRIPRQSLRKDVSEILLTNPLEYTENQEKSHVSTPLASIPFLTSLTDKARDGMLMPFWGRESEMHHILITLSRHHHNHPLIIGDAGVGKTALIEGLVQHILTRNVPEGLWSAEVYSLDLGMLMTSSPRGESSLDSILEALSHRPNPVLVFLDDVHTLFSTAPSSDGHVFLKRLLNQNSFRILATTTWTDYKRSLERDTTITRRFEVISLKEPSLDEATSMIRFHVKRLENHHGVRIADDALHAAVQMTHRFLPDRRLPDQAVRILDTACAQVMLSQKGQPSAIRHLLDKQHVLRLERDLLLKDGIIAPFAERLKALDTDLKRVETTYQDQMNLWLEQKRRLDQAQSLENHLPSTETNVDRTLITRQQRQDALFDHNALGLFDHVNRYAIAHGISDISGIPVSSLLEDGGEDTLDSLMRKLGQYVVGQQYGLQRIAETLLQYRAGLNDVHKPIGVFFVAGPSGVGKTETAMALSEILTGQGRRLIRLNMNEFQEAHSVSKLKGAPPGYIGYGRGGTLTESVRRNPHSVILMDEIDKAHPDILNLFYQIFDKGILEDSEGIEVDFSHTVLILTSNDGAERIEEKCRSRKKTEDDHLIYEWLVDRVRDELNQHYGVPFIGRTTVIPYLSLTSEEIQHIVFQKLEKISAKILKKHHVRVSYPETWAFDIATRFQTHEHGIRAIEGYLQHTILPIITQKILTKDFDIENGDRRICVGE